VSVISQTVDEIIAEEIALEVSQFPGKNSLEKTDLLWWATERKNPMFGVYHAMLRLGFNYDRAWGYEYRLTLRILNQMVESGHLWKYSTGQNETVFCIRKPASAPF